MTSTPSEKTLADDLLIVIVLYQIRLEDSIAFQSLKGLTGESVPFFIYDNSPDFILENRMRPNIIYRHDPTNSGVSKAYNEGSKEADRLNKRWIILSDQDTLYPPTYFKDLMTVMQNHPKCELMVPIVKDKIGFLSPFQFRFGQGARLNRIEAGEYSLSSYCFINSGSLISQNLFKKAGGYDEQFPLDFSDIAFVHRLRKIQSTFFVTASVCNQQHSASESQNLNEQSHRFDMYCQAALRFGQQTNSNFLYKVLILIRALKLSLLQNKSSFLKIALNHLF